VNVRATLRGLAEAEDIAVKAALKAGNEPPATPVREYQATLGKVRKVKRAAGTGDRGDAARKAWQTRRANADAAKAAKPAPVEQRTPSAAEADKPEELAKKAPAKKATAKKAPAAKKATVSTKASRGAATKKAAAVRANAAKKAPAVKAS
jgi:hypothetical protein